MKNERKSKSIIQKKKKDILRELMEREGIDEMGLLDLVFIEEILNQKGEVT